MAKGNRFSSLPVSQYCPKSAALNLGAGRAAAVSSVFHARCAGDDKWREAYARLTDEEQAEVDAMIPPDDVNVRGNVFERLSYSAAKKEVALGLTEQCGYVPKGHPDALCEGTCDMYWVRNRTAYVVDLKRSEYTTAEGPESLQVKGYALAVCALHADEVDGYVTGIYAATEGTWSFADYISLDSEQCVKDWERVKAAAMNVDGDYATGVHCRSCYSRFKCPAYLVPPGEAHEGITRYFSGELDNTKALELLRFTERVEDTCKQARLLLKAVAEVNGIIDPESGKVYRAVMCKGKVSLDKKSLETEHPELVQKFMVQGKGYPQFRWVNGEKNK